MIVEVNPGPPHHSYYLSVKAGYWTLWYWDGSWWDIEGFGPIPFCWHEAGT